MLTLLIPRKESVKSENLDVYLKPLVKELQMLWKGVTIVESYGQKGHKHLCFGPFVCGAYMIISHMVYLWGVK
jgi:hypothetical protein